MKKKRTPALQTLKINSYSVEHFLEISILSKFCLIWGQLVDRLSFISEAGLNQWF